MNKKIYLPLTFFIAFLILFLLLIVVPKFFSPIKDPKYYFQNEFVYIAHAGGAIDGKFYTNSLEALNQNYKKGFRLFEIDFNWTKDDELVAVHDWEENNTLFFNNALTTPPTHKEFMNAPMLNNMTQLDLKSLNDWLKKHRDAYIVTDIKYHNITGLKKMINDYPNIKEQIIPQIHKLYQYSPVKELGFTSIILTLYSIKSNHQQIYEFCASSDIAAVTIWKKSDSLKSNLPSKIQSLNIPIYIHTVNDLNLLASLRENRMSGIYTDTISPIAQ